MFGKGKENQEKLIKAQEEIIKSQNDKITELERIIEKQKQEMSNNRETKKGSAKNERVTVLFTKSEFNILMQQLEIQNNDKCLETIRKHYYVKEIDGDTYIAINYFGTQLRDILYSFLNRFPSSDNDQFDTFVNLYHQKRKYGRSVF